MAASLARLLHPPLGPQAQPRLQRPAPPKSWRNHTLLLPLLRDCGAHSEPCGAAGRGYEVLGAQRGGELRGPVRPPCRAALRHRAALVAGRWAAAAPAGRRGGRGQLLQSQLGQVSALDGSGREVVASAGGGLEARLDSGRTPGGRRRRRGPRCWAAAAGGLQRATGPPYRDLQDRGTRPARAAPGRWSRLSLLLALSL